MFYLVIHVFLVSNVISCLSLTFMMLTLLKIIGPVLSGMSLRSGVCDASVWFGSGRAPPAGTPQRKHCVPVASYWVAYTGIKADASYLL